MCINMQWVRNKYSQQKILVKCGKCPACQQEKANRRKRRILNNSSKGTIALFITLTYAPNYLPYIEREDIPYLKSENGFFKVPVYRDYRFRKYRGVPRPVHYDSDLKSIQEYVEIPEDKFSYSMFSFMKDARGSRRGKVGVALYKDVQTFLKRLRINLERNYPNELNKNFSYYICTEYGPTTDRPHIHGLLFVQSDTKVKEMFKSAITESWPYGCFDRTGKSIQESTDAAGYVSSYVNQSNSRVSSLQGTRLSQKHSYSQGFGCMLDVFRLSSILQKIDSRDLRYRITKVVDKIPVHVNVPIPQYVINRYFPKFKGYSILGNDEISRLLFSPVELSKLVRQRCIERGLIHHVDGPIYSQNFRWDNDDVYKWSVRLHNLRQLFKKELGWSDSDFINLYPTYYVRCWTLYYSTCFVDMHREITTLDDYKDFYDNYEDIYEKVDFDTGQLLSFDTPAHSDLYDIFSITDVELNPNRRRSVVHTSSRLFEEYHRRDKYRKVMNSIMSEQGQFV